MTYAELPPHVELEPTPRMLALLPIRCPGSPAVTNPFNQPADIFITLVRAEGKTQWLVEHMPDVHVAFSDYELHPTWDTVVAAVMLFRLTHGL